MFPYLSFPLTLTQCVCMCVFTGSHTHTHNVDKCCYHMPEFIQALEKHRILRLLNADQTDVTQTSELDSHAPHAVSCILKTYWVFKYSCRYRGETLITTLTKVRPPKLEVINCPWGLSGNDSTNS